MKYFVACLLLWLFALTVYAIRVSDDNGRLIEDVVAANRRAADAQQIADTALKASLASMRLTVRLSSAAELAINAALGPVLDRAQHVSAVCSAD